MFSLIIGKVLKNYYFVIEFVGGVGNFFYKLMMFVNVFCVMYVLLDNDEVGMKVYDKVFFDGMLKVVDIIFVNCCGMVVLEIEDIFEWICY